VKQLSLRVENRVQAWAIMGPLMLLAASVVCLVKSHSFDWMLPTIATLGIGACWRWKMTGLIGTVVTLFFYLLLTYNGVAIEDRFWHVGTAMAATLGLVITALSFEEVDSIVGTIVAESQSRLQNICRIDEKLKNASIAWQQERTALLEQLNEVATQLQEKETRVATFERLIGVVRQDLEAAQKEHERILGELFEQRSLVANLTQDLVEAGQSKPRSNLERTLRQEQGRLKQLRCQFEEKDCLLHEARQQRFAAEEKLEALTLDYREETCLKNHELYSHLVKTENLCQSQQEEIEQLEELVAMLAGR